MSFSVGFSSTSIIQPKLLVDFTIIHKEKKKRVLGEGVFGSNKIFAILNQPDYFIQFRLHMIQQDFWRRIGTYYTWIPFNFCLHAHAIFLGYLPPVCLLSQRSLWLVLYIKQVGQILKSWVLLQNSRYVFQHFSLNLTSKLNWTIMMV